MPVVEERSSCNVRPQSPTRHPNGKPHFPMTPRLPSFRGGSLMRANHSPSNSSVRANGANPNLVPPGWPVTWRRDPIQ